ncbi:hypothetical protein JX265_000941 [Neoarthrinium moseri]|uniref:Glutathione S-transferase II n=1 Tax=Neoarthrinium moseri TaxID=1658444 RepID=A0A9P9WX73_9PEZI|nr:hypothetical protein JX266_007826 [Neoarthrinium moseri]KAI1880701.1 hypothetical protein JX265_000941 [Neoarthrinium moseri]
MVPSPIRRSIMLHKHIRPLTSTTPAARFLHYSARSASPVERLCTKTPAIGITNRIETTVNPRAKLSSVPKPASFSTASPKLQQPPQSQAPAPDDEMSEPTGLIANKGIELLTLGTPNGYKASILLEELKEAYGLEYTWQAINIMKNTQKQPWYTAICPNGRIPAIVDHERGGFAVFEGIAILGYLARVYDREHRFSFPVDSDDYSVCEQWIGWQHGGLGPMQGQANHFLKFAAEKIPYATQRYVGESERLYGILDARLRERDYVAGPGRGRYSIADISLLGWANIATFSGLDLAQFPSVRAWLDRCMQRPAVQRGFAVPNVSALSNAKLAETLEADPEAKKKSDASWAFLKESKEKYGYKYASP